MGKLLGITGAIGSGKSTFAELLAAAEPDHAIYESRTLVTEIANAFNKALKAELTYETVNQPLALANQVLIWLPDAIAESLHHDVVWNQLTITKHHTLAHPDYFDKLWRYFKQVEQAPKLLDKEITAKNKAAYRDLLQWLGNYLVVKISKTIWYDEIMRRIELHDKARKMVVVTGLRYPSDAEVVRTHGGIVIGMKRPEITEVANDPTEAQRHSIEPDIAVLNNGDLPHLQQLAQIIWHDIGAGTRQATYRAV